MAGDFIADPENLAVVAGQITSGFIPLVDIRDVVGNLSHGDYLFAGLSAVSLVPVAGDAAKTTGKVSKFIAKNLDNVPEVSKLLEFINKNFPDLFKQLGKSDEFIEAAKKLKNDDVLRLTKREADRIVKTLEEAGIPKETFGDWYRLFEYPSSKELTKNLIAAGIVKPDYACAAHHIVAGASPYAVETRKILRQFGIGINDAANGVFLPAVKNISGAAYHPALHNGDYYEKVNKLLRFATSKEEVIDILQDIAEELVNGTF